MPRTETQTEAQAAGPQPLKLSISSERQSVAAPFSLRVTLRLHNSGQTSLWLYRHARDESAVRRSQAAQAELGEGAGSLSSGASILAVHLQPLEAHASGGPTIAAEPQGTVLESVGLPHPRLVKVMPGEDYEEKAVVRLVPAVAPSGGRQEPVWGHYRLSATYAARFSNADEIARNLGVTLWQGEVTSNAIDVELEPAPATAQGSVAGTVANPEKRPLEGIWVSLSDQQERPVNQVLTDPQGRFSFTRLPLGLYWMTARRENSTMDTATFEHVELTPTSPTAAIELVMLPPETYQAKQIVHKPVLFRVTDGVGRPIANVSLEVVWSSGTVIDNVKGQTSEDGTVTLNLIPGRNYVTLKQRGCPKQEERADVAEGGGIDDFRLTLACAGK